jgi:threonyl-tRNA synthetase
MTDDIEVVRHSLAHILAAAVKVVLPGARLGTGPAIDEGFYYDFLLPKGQAFTAEIQRRLEEEMRKLIQRDVGFVRETVKASAAVQLFQAREETLKLELLDDLSRDGHDSVSLYHTGIFTDLCAGPHVESTRDLRTVAFRLDRVAGAYWRGSEEGPMLQRVYGLAFENQGALDDFLVTREEAMKRDHRKLGAELELFATSPLVGKGLPLLLPKGAALRRVLERFIVDEEISRGYQHVYTPSLGRQVLYETSGHWEHYKDSMYPSMDIGGETLILRPMTCPHHFMVYSYKPRSYRELPVRLAEIASQHRREQSGELSGLMRVMMFHLADSHIVCRPDQIREEFAGVLDLVAYAMARLGVAEQIAYRASLSDDTSGKYVQNPELWEKSEKILLDIVRELRLPHTVAKGEAAFYGPKLDVQMRNVLGKEETAFTVQIDFALPDRFGLRYTAEDGQEKCPVAIHRSSIGCLERTMAFLIEHYAGAFPCWLAPVQVRLLTITDSEIPFAEDVTAKLVKAGIRCELDKRNEKIGKKVREGRLQKIPYLGTIGKREVDAFVSNITREINSYSLELQADSAGSDS